MIFEQPFQNSRECGCVIGLEEGICKLNQLHLSRARGSNNRTSAHRGFRDREGKAFDVRWCDRRDCAGMQRDHFFVGYARARPAIDRTSISPRAWLVGRAWEEFQEPCTFCVTRQLQELRFIADAIETNYLQWDPTSIDKV